MNREHANCTQKARSTTTILYDDKATTPITITILNLMAVCIIGRPDSFPFIYDLNAFQASKHDHEGCPYTFGRVI